MLKRGGQSESRGGCLKKGELEPADELCLLWNGFFSHSFYSHCNKCAYISIFECIQNPQGNDISANAMVSLPLMGLHFLVLFCFKTITKGYKLCQSAFKLLLERFVYWKSNVSIQSNSSFFTILHTLCIIHIRTLNCLRKKLKIWKNLYASKKKQTP